MSTMHQFSNPEILRSVGDRLVSARKARGWSQRDLARHARVSRNTVQNAERGEDVSLSTALRLWRAVGLLDVFGVPVELAPRPRRRVGQPAPFSPIELLRRERESGRLA